MIDRIRSAQLFAVSLTLLANTASAVFDINEGELHFLDGATNGGVHHHHKYIVITPESLKTGWIVNRQCHYNLDQVSALEVVFSPGNVRGLDITRADNIKKSWVEGSSVQLQDIGPNAALCLYSENHVFKKDATKQRFTLVSGPYMRRFLDGYFPMRVSLYVDYPPNLLQFADLTPKHPRLKTTAVPGHVRVDTLFEGRLLLTLQFTAINPVP